MRKLWLIFILLFGILANAQTSAEKSYITEDITFKNGEISLAGRLHLPKGKNNVPAVIFTHGSGAVDGRNNQRFILETEYLVQKGIAVLLFDKRGAGGSTGDWKKSDFNDLAADAISAFRFLKTKKEINPRKIGFRGASQAGYVLPIVGAKLKKEVAFIVIISPAVVTPAEQIIFQIETALRGNRVSDNDIKEAVAYTHAGLDFARTGKNWEIYQDFQNRNKEKPWFKIAQGPSSKDDFFFDWIGKVADFDATPFFKKTVCPMLIYFGSEDTLSPVKVAQPRLEKILQKQAKSNKIIVYPKSGHDLRYQNEQGQRTLPADYLESLSRWILER